jgi:hypothetical protein
MFEGLVGVILVSTLVAWLISATRAEPMLGWFCFQYDVPDSASARSLVRAYLFRTRMWRVLGAGTGFVVPLAVVSLTDVEISLVISICIGWLSAGLVAEMTGRHRRRHEPTVASPWTPSDLLSPAARHTIAATTLTTILSIVLAVATRHSPMVLREGVSLPTPARVFAACGATALLAAITWRGLHSIGRAPFPITANDLDLAEHAIRVASAVRVIAGWSALQLVCTGWLSWQTAELVRSPFSWLPTALAGTSVLGAAVAWWWMPTRLVRRDQSTLLAS